MKRLLICILGAGVGLWLATLIISGVAVTLYKTSNFFGIPLAYQWQLFVLFGVALGLLNFFVKPILNVITLPLRIITLGLFGFIINMALLWVVASVFTELQVPLFWPLIWTTLIIWLLQLILSKLFIHEPL